MDLIKIGKFISELRHEKNLTQEELGEKIGVTNKTISRWENGNYLPSVDALQILSKEFCVSINELLCGERISEEKYKKMADETIISTLKASTFSLKEKCEFWKKKWVKGHLVLIAICIILTLGFICYGIFTHTTLVIGSSIFGAFAVYIILYNMMMAYVERNAYDGSGW